jgi:hypothetical protein
MNAQSWPKVFLALTPSVKGAEIYIVMCTIHENQPLGGGDLTLKWHVKFDCMCIYMCKYLSELDTYDSCGWFQVLWIEACEREKWHVD